ncbi:unnamed protein product [Closterium sp. NIES-64]|nr:unnamed protein product [Closterium sp. NIES-64]
MGCSNRILTCVLPDALVLQQQQCSHLPHYLPFSLPHYLPFSLPHYLPFSLPHYLPFSLPHYLPFSLPHYLPFSLPHYLPFSLPHYLPFSLPHYLPFSLPHYLPFSLPHYLPFSLPHYLPFSLPHYLPFSLPHYLPFSLPHYLPFSLPHLHPSSPNAPLEQPRWRAKSAGFVGQPFRQSLLSSDLPGVPDESPMYLADCRAPQRGANVARIQAIPRPSGKPARHGMAQGEARHLGRTASTALVAAAERAAGEQAAEVQDGACDGVTVQVGSGTAGGAAAEGTLFRALEAEEVRRQGHRMVEFIADYLQGVGARPVRCSVQVRCVCVCRAVPWLAAPWQKHGSVKEQGTGSVREQGTGSVREQGTGSVREQGTGSVREQGTGSVREQGTGSVREQGTGSCGVDGVLLGSTSAAAASSWAGRMLKPALTCFSLEALLSPHPSSPHTPPLPPSTVLHRTDISSAILPGVTHWQSPSFFAFFSSPTSAAAICGDALISALNVVGFSWAAAPTATELEGIVMDWMADLLGLPEGFHSVKSGEEGWGSGGCSSVATPSSAPSTWWASPGLLLPLPRSSSHCHRLAGGAGAAPWVPLGEVREGRGSDVGTNGLRESGAVWQALCSFASAAQTNEHQHSLRTLILPYLTPPTCRACLCHCGGMAGGRGGGVIHGTASEALLVVLLAARRRVLDRVVGQPGSAAAPGRVGTPAAAGATAGGGNVGVRGEATDMFPWASMPEGNVRVLPTTAASAYALTARQLLDAVQSDEAAGLLPFFLILTVSSRYLAVPFFLTLWKWKLPRSFQAHVIVSHLTHETVRVCLFARLSPPAASFPTLHAAGAWRLICLIRLAIARTDPGVLACLSPASTAMRSFLSTCLLCSSATSCQVGSTSSTTVDPIAPLAAIAKEHGMWVHVDAAYAGMACMCTEMRHHLAGMHLADSLASNAHKWLLTRFGCCCLWTQDSTLLVEQLSILPEYLTNKASERQQVVDWEIPIGRRFRSLKLWMVLRTYGAEGIRAYIRRHVALAEWFEEAVRQDERFQHATHVLPLPLPVAPQLMAPRPFALVCFRLKPPAPSAFTHSGMACGGQYTLRMAIGAVKTGMTHVQAAWRLIQTEASKLLQEGKFPTSRGQEEIASER